MVSIKHKCVFVHIPKTGGVSIAEPLFPVTARRGEMSSYYSLPEAEKDAFSYLDGMGASSPRHGFNKYREGALGHLPVQYIREEIGEKMFEEYFKFAFVRNPWDRAVSQFFHLTQGSVSHGERPDLQQWLRISRSGVYSSPCFEEYLEAILRAPAHVFFIPQVEFILDDGGNPLIDFIGRFEDLQKDFNTVCDTIGFPRTPLGADTHKTARKYRSYHGFYSPAAKEMVAEIYKKDIEYFKYQYEPHIES